MLLIASTMIKRLLDLVVVNPDHAFWQSSLAPERVTRQDLDRWIRIMNP
jgi:hypothetical protein